MRPPPTTPLSSVVEYRQVSGQTGVAVSLAGSLLDQVSSEIPAPALSHHWDVLACAVARACYDARRHRYRELAWPYLTAEQRRHLGGRP